MPARCLPAACAPPPPPPAHREGTLQRALGQLGHWHPELRRFAWCSCCLQVVVAPVLRFRDVGSNADVRLDFLGPPDKLIAGAPAASSAQRSGLWRGVCARACVLCPCPWDPARHACICACPRKVQRSGLAVAVFVPRLGPAAAASCACHSEQLSGWHDTAHQHNTSPQAHTLPHRHC